MSSPTATLITSTFSKTFCHGPSSRVDPLEQQEFLSQDRGGEIGIEALEVRALRDELAPRRQDPRPGDPAGVNRVPQLDIAVDPRVPEVTHGGEAALEIFPSELGSDQHSLAWRLDDREQQSRGELGVVSIPEFRLSGHCGVQKQVRVAVDQPGHEGRAAEIDPLDAGRRVGLHLRWRADLLDLVSLDQHGGRR
jgi:hypothetical protein